MSKVFFIHGWSVDSTTTYQSVHQQLGQYGFQLEEVFLGRYVSLEDRVEIGDLARAMHNELFRLLDGNWKQPFHFVTHSTGALIVKKWIADLYAEDFATAGGLKNVIFLAGPQFGSRLAHHGKSMLANAVYAGDTGDKILEALELGSDFIWNINKLWLDETNWKAKGIRPYCITGDRVDKSVGDWFKEKIMPANYEEGSDMVIRVPAANLNHKRFRIAVEHQADGTLQTSFTQKGEIKGIPFAALKDYTHSGINHGVLNSITTKSTPANHLALDLLLLALNVNSNAGYADAFKRFADETAATATVRKKRFAQLDFMFCDQDGNPINDYVFKLGAIVNGEKRPSDTVYHTHKNTVTGNHFTVFISMKELEPQYDYFFELDSDSGSLLFSFQPDPLTVKAEKGTITDIIVAEQTTQIEVVLQRTPDRNLFVYHKGNDPDLHITWDRRGIITGKNKVDE